MHRLRPRPALRPRAQSARGVSHVHEFPSGPTSPRTSRPHVRVPVAPWGVQGRLLVLRETTAAYLLQVYLLILSVTTLSLLLAPVLWRAAVTRCAPRPERRSSL